MRTMNMWVRNIGVGCMSIATVLTVFFTGGNEKSYAVEGDRYEDEMKEAFEAYENMDPQSQQQMLASVHSGAPAILTGEDITTTIMRVQQARLQELDSQLKKQLYSVREGDQQLQELNELLKTTNAMDQAIRNSNNPEDVMVLLLKMSEEMRNAARESRQQELNKTIEDLQAKAEEIREAANNRYKGAIIQQTIALAGGATRVVNSEIKVQSQNQKMDMDRLQSLNNKRNETIERMAKYQEQLQGTSEEVITKFN